MAAASSIGLHAANFRADRCRLDRDGRAAGELRCGRPDSSAVGRFRRGYRANVAPSIELALTDESGALIESSVRPGEPIALIASVPSCAEEEACGGRERYLRYDAASASLSTERESLRLAWYATAGTLAFERNGLAGDEGDTALGNTWTSSEPGEVTLIVVARDDRGGAPGRRER